ncbi:MAG: cytochrome c-type biogenesis protein CcmH [Anaerolineales bacterium]|nr:cytochrome c-type biogenesis protein CcmH [Anaerolineales bacterium]
MNATVESNIARNTKYAVVAAILLFLISLFISFSVASAQGPEPTDDEVNRIAKKLYCPVCENTPLDVCPTEACRQWREQIREMLRDGKSEAEIIDYFAVTYGERAAGDPRDKVKAYLLPALAILAGAALLVRALQMWMKPPQTESIVPAKDAGIVQQDEYVARIEEELKKRN